MYAHILCVHLLFLLWTIPLRCDYLEILGHVHDAEHPTQRLLQYRVANIQKLHTKLIRHITHKQHQYHWKSVILSSISNKFGLVERGGREDYLGRSIGSRESVELKSGHKWNEVHSSNGLWWRRGYEGARFGRTMRCGTGLGMARYDCVGKGRMALATTLVNEWR